WQQSDGTTQNAVSNRFDGSAWGTAELIESDNGGIIAFPQIAVDGTGKAFAVWQQSDGTRFNIVSNRFDGSTWGTAELIESDNAGAAFSRKLRSMAPEQRLRCGSKVMAHAITSCRTASNKPRPEL
ncbi:hypothetical protein SAMN04488073_3043, partial [Marinobacter gudaonensis]